MTMVYIKIILDYLENKNMNTNKINIDKGVASFIL